MAGPSTVEISNVNSTLLPPTITGPIFVKAVEQSAVMRLSRQVPLALTAQTAVPIPLNVPIADFVVEGGVKPVSSSGVGLKTMSGKKVAVLVPVSEEVVRSNPAALYSQLQNDLPTAIARAFDYAAIHGRTITGNASPFNDSLIETSNSVTLGTTSVANGGLYVDLVNGEALVENNNYDFSGFVADPRIRTQLKTAVTTQGMPIFTSDVISGAGIGSSSPMNGGGSGILDGFPIAFNRGVSGNLYRQTNVGSRSVSDGVTASSTTVTSATANFTAADVGKKITGAGIPASTTITARGSATSITISNAATATATGVSLTFQLAAADTLLRAVGGDWSQAAYGVGMDISIRVSNEASYTDTDGTVHSAFQENLVLLLAEAYYGFVIGDVNAFVTYVHS